MPDDLRILAFDTSAAHCAAAVICGDRVLCARVEPMAKGQAERLFPLLEELLVEAGLSWSDLDAIGVGTGPGNFTGIRISVAAARGLALSLGIPAVGVPATEAAACDSPRPCRAVVTLRADEVVWQDFGANGQSGPRLVPATQQDARAPRAVAQQGGGLAGADDLHPMEARASAPDKAAEAAVTGSRHADGPTDAAGPALAKMGELPPGPPACAPVHPVAVAIARLAGERAAATGAAAGTPLRRPAPLYLRPADAAPPRDPPPVILR